MRPSRSAAARTSLSNFFKIRYKSELINCVRLHTFLIAEEEILNKNDKKIIEEETLEANFRNPNINKNDKRDTLDKINKIFYSL